MRSEDFSLRLGAATFLSWKFATTIVKDKLPPEFVFDVVLNSSADDGRKDDEMVYPEDDHRLVEGLSQADVVSLLCRDGRVPQWIDVSVSSAGREVTYIRLICCGRYHDKDDRLYYYERGTQPFGIKSPDYPRGNISKNLNEVRRFKLPSHEKFITEELSRIQTGKDAEQDVPPKSDRAGG